MSNTYAPEPSPAPTLAGVPGYFPPTPDSSAHEDPLESHSTSTSTTTDNQDEYSHKVNNAVGVAVAATAGLLVGGPVGSVIAGGIVGLVESENDGLKAHADELAPAGGEETARSEPEKAFNVQEQNSQSALEGSPAQKLANSDGDEGSNLTRAGALGGALLAGGAGAKVAENEVSEPTNEDLALTPTATRQELPVCHFVSLSFETPTDDQSLTGTTCSTRFRNACDRKGTS